MVSKFQVKEAELTVPNFQQFGDGHKFEIFVSRVLFFRLRWGRLCCHGRIPVGSKNLRLLYDRAIKLGLAGRVLHSLRKITSEDLFHLLSSSLGAQAFIQKEGMALFLLALSPKQLEAQVILLWNHDA